MAEEKETFEIAQSSLVQATPQNRSIDLMLETAIHNDWLGAVCKILKKYPPNELVQLRRCTIKAMTLYYAKTVIFRDEKHLLCDALGMLESLYEGEHSKQPKETMKTWEVLKRGIHYQIGMHQLTALGAQPTLTLVDLYFPSSCTEPKDLRMRSLLLAACDAVQNNTPMPVNRVPWTIFKRWVKAPLKNLLQSCEEPMLEQVARLKLQQEKQQIEQQNRSSM